MKHRISALAACALLFPPLPGAARAADGLRVDSHGFSFGAIDSAWKPEPVDTGSDSAVTLVLQHPAGARASVRAEILPVGKSAAIMAKERIAYARASAEYTNVVEASRKAGDRRVEGISVHQKDGGGVEYRVRQFFVVEYGLLFTLQELALAAGAAQKDGLFGDVWSALEFREPSAELTQTAKLRALAARCGGEIDWAKDWDDAAKRARGTGRSIVVLMRLYPGLPDTDVATAGPWMDVDVVDLVRERFVALHFESGMEVPFRTPELYGLSATSFGNSVLIVAPDGRVLGDDFVADPFALLDFLRSTLPAAAAQGGPRLDEGERLLRAGEFDAAEKKLATGGDSARRHRLLGDLCRRRRDGDGALRELEQARAQAEEPARAVIDVDAAVVLLRLGRNDEAAARLERALAARPEPAVAARALYWLGAAAASRFQMDVAAKHWDRLMAEHPDDRWSWLAAADRTGFLAGLGAGASLRWPAEDLLASVRSPARAPLPRAKQQKAERDALAFLLATQRADGSWSNPTELEGTSAYSADPFVDAGTAICGLALLAHRGEPRAHAALERALGFVLAQQPRWPLAPSAVFFMDYTPWRHAYVLRFLAACVAAQIGDATRLRSEMDGIVARLDKLQQAGGGWTYFLTSELATQAAPQGPQIGPSISFVTAAVVAALEDAQEQRVAVDQAMLGRALDCLAAMEGTNGAYRYWVMPGDEGPHPDEGRPGAAGRGPLCAHALLRSGRRDVAGLRGALDIFLAHGAELAREQGKSLMHCGAEGQGSHYLSFDYANAALAVRALPAHERERYAAPLLGFVLAGRLADGSFVDNPVLGRATATGFALLVFHALGRET